MDAVEEILESLTLMEKAALLSGASMWQTRDLGQKGLPAVWLSDGPTGLRKQEGEGDHLGLNQSVPATCFPTAATVANSWNLDLAEQVGQALGEEARAKDVQGLLGPGLNIKRNPLCGRNFEYFSEDPHLSGKLAAAYIRGIQSTGVSAVPKHFAVNSQELRRMASNSVVDERTLRELYLTGFEIAVKEGRPRAIMSSYNRINGTYANENRHLLMDILRGDWGFKGAVITDWGGSNDHIEATKNGSDLEMPSPGSNGPFEIMEAVRNGRLSQADVDARAREMIDFILAAEHRPSPDMRLAEHHQVARAAAREGIVLLKNDNGILPLAPQTKVALIGDFAANPRYQGAGSSVVNSPTVENSLEQIKHFPLDLVGYAPGFARNQPVDVALEAQALALAKQADVVLLYIGLPETSETEGQDRSTLSLPTNQLHLLARLAQAGVPVVAVLSAGSVVDCSWADQVSGLLDAYLGGEAGASALLEVICGQQSPSGKLAESFPLAYADVPFGTEYPAQDVNSLYKESLYVGYRYYDSTDRPVRYPFGHGLSYTTFEYSDLRLSPDGADFTLTNSGSVAAAEVAQLYVSSPDRQTYHPAHELKGFAKVSLQPGQSTTVHIDFDFDAFRTFEPSLGRWLTLPGDYQIAIGASSRDIRLTGSLPIDGPAVSLPDRATALPHYFSGQVYQASPAEVEQLLAGCGRVSAAQPGQLDVNSTFGDLAAAKSPLARLAARRLKRSIKRAEAKGQPTLNLLFVYNMPLRAMAKMTFGVVDMAMVRDIVLMVNGHAFKGTGRLISEFFRHRRAQRQFDKQIGQ